MNPGILRDSWRREDLLVLSRTRRNLEFGSLQRSQDWGIVIIVATEQMRKFVSQCRRMVVVKSFIQDVRTYGGCSINLNAPVRRQVDNG